MGLFNECYEFFNESLKIYAQDSPNLLIVLLSLDLQVFIFSEYTLILLSVYAIAQEIPYILLVAFWSAVLFNRVMSFNSEVFYRGSLQRHALHRKSLCTGSKGSRDPGGHSRNNCLLHQGPSHPPRAFLSSHSLTVWRWRCQTWPEHYRCPFRSSREALWRTGVSETLRLVAGQTAQVAVEPWGLGAPV